MAPFFTFKSVRFHAGQIKSSEDFRMAEITASLVKELRERTGAGMMAVSYTHLTLPTILLV